MVMKKHDRPNVLAVERRIEAQNKQHLLLSHHVDMGYAVFEHQG